MRIGTSVRRLGGVRTLMLGVLVALTAPLAIAALGTTPFVGPFFGQISGQAVAQAVPAGGVTIRGNRRIEVATILSYMQLPTDRAVTAEDLNAAVRRLFDTGLFRDVQLIPGGGQLVVEVVENPSINEIAFEGNKALKDDDLKKIIHLKPRLPFTPSAAEADAQAIIDVYRRTGRYGAEVEPVIIERPDNRVDLVFQIREGAITGVSAITFVGNDRYSDRKLRRVIETRKSGWLSLLFSTDVYDPDRLELDKELLRQFYLSHGYADFTVLSATAELSPDRKGFYITFTVSEGEQYTFGTQDVSITARGLDPAAFEEAVPTKLEGRTYDADEVEKVANKLTDLAGQQGFAFVQVRPRAQKDAENRVINITYELAEGSRIFVERIDIEGNTRTLDRVIRRDMKLVEGDAFDTRKIRQSRAKIRGLGYFKKVEIETEQGSAEDRAVLKVKVQEQSTGSLSLGLGFSSAVGPIGNISVIERNFLGRGQILNFQLTATQDTRLYNFSFTEPRFLDRDLSVAARAFYTTDNRSSESSFKQNSAGFGPEVGFPLSENLRLKLRYNFVQDRIRVGTTTSPVIQADAGTRITSSVGYSLAYDRRNDPIEPTKGFLLSFDQQIAGLGGASRYVKSQATAKLWQGVLDDRIVASVEASAGAVFAFDKNTRVTERYFLGGENLRGFADYGIGPRDLNNGKDVLGGNFFSSARFEVSFPIGLPEELGIFGGAFLDVGTVWGLDQTHYSAVNPPNTADSNIDDAAYLRVAAGALLFLDTPFGPLQLSFGFPLVKKSYDKEEFFRLSIGTRF